MDHELLELINTLPLRTLLDKFPLAADFLENMRIPIPRTDITFPKLLENLDATVEEEFGTPARELPEMLYRFLMTFNCENTAETDVSSLTIIGGNNKNGQPENITFTLQKGEVTAIVGPTGSGKSRLLGDIECLAQRDTPTGRLILIDGLAPSDDRRFEMDGKLVAQLSQNMNFIMDLTVREFLEMHARSRFSKTVGSTVEDCLECANTLSGESFTQNTKVTQLSGGQSRALMIADTAFMSSSPVVLIDEIENAGIDRRQAVKVLAKEDKIVLIATHDPLLALSADKRVVIRNGGIWKTLETAAGEKNLLDEIEQMDNTMQRLRNKLRAGEQIYTIR
jgi:ABC-type lipoprotein export system ATPase subunit